MVVSSGQTLLVFGCIFGIIGAARGPYREIWTLSGIGLTALLLVFGGVPILQQLPLRLAAAVLALSGNQNGSNDMAAHPLGAPWTNIMLWVLSLGFVGLSYLIGQRFGGSKPETVGAAVGGFLMGAINGLVIAVFIFQNGLATLNVQFPDGLLSRTNMVLFIIIGFGAALLALFIFRQDKAPAKS